MQLQSLVGLSSSLASFLYHALAPLHTPKHVTWLTYQLIQVPSANAHITPVVIHALAEVANVSRTGRVLVGGVGGVALPQAAVHGLGVCRGGLLRLSRSARASGEETTDGVADRGTDCDTTVENNR